MINRAVIDVSVYPYNLLSEAHKPTKRDKNSPENIDIESFNKFIDKLSDFDQYLIKYYYVEKNTIADTIDKLEGTENLISPATLNEMVINKNLRAIRLRLRQNQSKYRTVHIAEVQYLASTIRRLKKLLWRVAVGEINHDDLTVDENTRTVLIREN